MKGVNWTPIIITVLIVAGVLTAFLYAYPRQASDRVVEATGNAQKSVPPDRVVVYLQVLTKSSSAEDAKNSNSETSSKVLAALSAIGAQDVQTENYNIYPEYDYNNGKQTIIDYAASNSIKVTSKDFTNVGKIVDASVNSGALVSYINFELSTEKQNEYKASALSDAAKDAKTKAEAIASGLGKNLGSLVSVSTSDYNYMPYPFLRAEASGISVKDVPTQLPSKNLDISATVTARYEIN